MSNADDKHAQKSGKDVGKDPRVLKAEQAWNNGCQMLGLKKDMLGKTFMSDMTNYRILGLLVKRNGMPVLVERVSDKQKMVFAVPTVLAGLK